MLKHLIVLVALVFALGWLSHVFYADLQGVQAAPFVAPQDVKTAVPAGISVPKTTEIAAEQIPDEFEPAVGARERASPADRFQLSDIHVTNSRVTIDSLPGHVFETAIFTDTNSMDPLIDDGAQAIQIVPLSHDEIKVGDVISYDSGRFGIIIHRVIQIGNDEQGWYATVKGDNNPSPDPVKVRFPMIRRVLVGVLY